MGVWGGMGSGAEWSMGRMGVRGGREPGAEWSLGRKGALGGPTDRRGFQPALAPNTSREATFESHELAVPYGIRAAGPGCTLAAGPGLQARIG